MLVLAFITMSRKSDDKMAQLMLERDFKVAQVDKIQKLVISPKGQNQTILIKKSNRWYLNGDKLIRDNPINNLLDVLAGIRIQYVPERTANKNILRDIDRIGIHVEAFSSGGKSIKSFHIGSVTPDERGTYAMMDGHKQPFVVEMLNFEGSIRNRFLLKEIDWLDRTVLKEKPDNISEIRVDYPKDRSESFTVRRAEAGFEIANSALNAEQFGPVSDQNKMKAYFEAYDLLEAEYIENLNPKRESVSKMVPFAAIEITRKDGSAKSMKLFPIKDLLYENKSTVEIEQQKYISRYFLDSSSGDFFLVQQRLVGKFLRGYRFFTDES